LFSAVARPLWLGLDILQRKVHGGLILRGVKRREQRLHLVVGSGDCGSGPAVVLAAGGCLLGGAEGTAVLGAAGAGPKDQREQQHTHHQHPPSAPPGVCCWVHPQNPPNVHRSACHLPAPAAWDAGSAGRYAGTAPNTASIAARAEESLKRFLELA